MAKQADNSKDKYELIFEDEQAVSIWKYDLSKTKGGPISVEYKWKASFLKEVEAIRKAERDAKKTKKSTLELAREAKKKKSSAEKKQEKKDKFDKKFWA